MRLSFIHEHRQRWPIAVQCRVLEVSAAAYYKSLGRTESDTSRKSKQIIDEIRRIRLQPKMDSYGSPRIHRELIRSGVACCKNTVAKLMRREGIRAKTAKKFRAATTDSNHDRPIAPNRLDQQFTAQDINQVWLTDFTYLPTKEGFTYLCTILDMHSRKIVGYATSRRIDAALAVAAIQQAIALRQPPAGLILHSDRGSQYASVRFQKTLAKHQILQSMSRKGNCYDNAPMESFFKTFKTEEVYQQPTYATHEQATRSVIDYIDRFYNRERLHSSLGYQSPVEFEQSLGLSG